MSEEKQIIEEMAKIISEKQNGGWKFVGDSEYTTDVSNEELAEHIYNAGYSKQSEWTSVEERLPEEFDNVLVYDGVVTVDHISVGGEWWYHNHDAVTHWMPLPEPPKKGGE